MFANIGRSLLPADEAHEFATDARSGKWLPPTGVDNSGRSPGHHRPGVDGIVEIRVPIIGQLITSALPVIALLGDRLYVMPGRILH